MTNLYKKQKLRKPIIPENIANFIGTQTSVSAVQLAKKFNISRLTALNYLSRLENSGRIFRIERGVYVTSEKLILKPHIDPSLKSINSTIKKQLPYADFVIWSNDNLSPFFHHVVAKHVFFIEAEKESLPAIKDVCIQNNYRAFDFKTIDERAYTLEREPIFLINKKDRYGSIQIGDVRTATVEKTIVDMIFLVTRKNYPLSGREIGRTIYNILETKSLNIGLMIRYATRRNMSAEVTRILAKLYQRYPHLKVLERFAAREKSIEKVVNEITGEY